MKLYILGNGGFANELLDQLFLHNDKYDFAGFITTVADKVLVTNKEGVNDFLFPKDARFILGVGTSRLRTMFIDIVSEHYILNDFTFPNICTDKAHISRLSSMGFGNIFCNYSSLNGNATIGNFNCFNIYSSINHDCSLGNNNILSPYAGIMGNCTIGNNNYLAANSVILPTVKVGDDNTISAGECVFDDLNSREFFQSGIIRKKP